MALQGLAVSLHELGRIVQEEVFFVLRELWLSSGGEQSFTGPGEDEKVRSDDVHASPPLCWFQRV